MGKKPFADDILINTIVGPTSHIKGDVSVAGVLRIDGDIDGNVSATGNIIMGKNARIRGNVHAPSITIGGVIYGDVIVPDGIVILSTGMVVGAILTTALRVHDDVIIHGFCSAVNDINHFKESEKAYKNKQALRASAFSSTSV